MIRSLLYMFLKNATYLKGKFELAGTAMPTIVAKGVPKEVLNLSPWWRCDKAIGVAAISDTALHPQRTKMRWKTLSKSFNRKLTS